MNQAAFSKFCKRSFDPSTRYNISSQLASGNAYIANNGWVSSSQNYHDRKTSLIHSVKSSQRSKVNEAKWMPSSNSLLDDKCFLKFETLHNLCLNATAEYENNPLFGTYHHEDGHASGGFQWMTYKEFGERVGLCRSVLKELGKREPSSFLVIFHDPFSLRQESRCFDYLTLGVTPHSKVGIISNNRHEWATIASATYSLNATLVPMYESQLPKDWNHILNDSQCTALVCSTEDIYLRVRNEVLPNCPLLNIDSVLCLDSPDGEPNSFEGAMSLASKDSRAAVVEPTPEDLANLIYTSGTTGKPKGVELTHSNQVSNIKAGRSMVVDPADFVQANDRSLAFLPWAHSYGQTCELWCLLSQGASLGLCRGIPHILEDLQMVQPTLLFAVPTLYKRVHDGVINMMQNSSPIQKRLMQAALQLGKENAAHRNKTVDENGAILPPFGFVNSLKYKLLDDIVLSKIRARFGGNLRAGFVAGAACPKEIIDFMDAIGIPICEGYGLTETSPVISMNVLNRRKSGSVGQVLNGVKVWILDSDSKPLAIGEEGEICCSGPNVMRGYHNNSNATREVISTAPDGESLLFHTGDIGKIDLDGFVSVTGRLKEQYKLENGKYVCPTPIEEAIGMSRFISQIVVCGANQPYNVALVVPDWNAIRSELKISEIDALEEELVNDTRVRGLISSEIKFYCYNIKKFEIPAAWMFVSPFTAANGMLTPKMSIRRHIVIKTYEDMILELYEGRASSGGYLGETKAA